MSGLRRYALERCRAVPFDGTGAPSGIWADDVERTLVRRVSVCHVLARRTQAMNPGDVAQSVLPLTSSDLSLITLFLHAHWLVKCVMIGLLAASVWVWAIVVDKLMLYARTRRAMDRFEQAFWSSQSLEELYKALSSRPAHSMAPLFVAAMREWKRSFETQTRSFAGLQVRIEKVMDVTIAREIERLERRLLVLATVGSAGPFV